MASPPVTSKARHPCQWDRQARTPCAGFRADTNHELDDALELLAAVETSTSWASVAAIWAAVEGLLARATDPGVAASDRMAAIVAASFVRAELVMLATAIQDCEGPIADAMRNEGRPFSKRLDDLYDSICSNVELPLLEVADLAATARLVIHSDPRATLARVQAYLSSAFRRLFQQRNLLLHGGRFDSVALPMTMRSVPLLVAAGLDRLVYALMDGDQTTTPLALAARATNELALVGSDGSRRLHRLLD